VSKRNVVPYLLFYPIPKFGKFWSTRRVVFHNLQIHVSLANRKAFGLMNWAPHGGIVVRVGFKPTAPRASPTGRGEWALSHVLARPPSRRPSDANVRDHARPSLSLMRTSLLCIQPRLFVGVGVRLVFRLQESTYLQQLSRLHMDSNLGFLLLHRKITKSTLKWIQPHVDTLSELVTITDFI
jgi:hypothetical protein